MNELKFKVCFPRFRDSGFRKLNLKICNEPYKFSFGFKNNNSFVHLTATLIKRYSNFYNNCYVRIYIKFS